MSVFLAGPPFLSLSQGKSMLFVGTLFKVGLNRASKRQTAILVKHTIWCGWFRKLNKGAPRGVASFGSLEITPPQQTQARTHAIHLCSSAQVDGEMNP